LGRTGRVNRASRACGKSRLEARRATNAGGATILGSGALRDPMSVSPRRASTRMK
jgi:hypothetical protein